MDKIDVAFDICICLFIIFIIGLATIMGLIMANGRQDVEPINPTYICVELVTEEMTYAINEFENKSVIKKRYIPVDCEFSVTITEYKKC